MGFRKWHALPLYLTIKEMRNEEGQAVVEYILMLVLVVSIVGIIAVSFKRSILVMWGSFTQDVAAACPHDCPKNSQYQFR
jgi:Flp pilus assembly pilin Flp